MPNGKSDKFYPTIAELIEVFDTLDVQTGVFERSDGKKIATSAVLKQLRDVADHSQRVQVEEQYHTDWLVHVGDPSAWPWIPESSPAIDLIKKLRAKY